MHKNHHPKLLKTRRTGHWIIGPWDPRMHQEPDLDLTVGEIVVLLGEYNAHGRATYIILAQGRAMELHHCNRFFAWFDEVT